MLWSADFDLWWKEGLFVSAICVGLFMCLCALLHASWNRLQSGTGICIMCYAVTLLLSCALLHRLNLAPSPPDAHPCLLAKSVAWMGATLALVFVQTQSLLECFSLGEMFVCAEMLSTLCYVALRSLPLQQEVHHPRELLSFIPHWIMASLAFSAGSCLAVRQWTVDRLHRIKGVTFQKRKNQFFSAVVHLMTLLSCLYLWKLKSVTLELLWLSFGSRQRRWLIVYWCGVLAGGIWSAQWVKSRTHTIIMRKWFHFVALFLFLPAYFLEPVFLQLALCMAQIVFVLAEGVRLSGIAGVSPVINRFLCAFTDHRDNGPIIISHFSLLLGMAMPIWIAPVVEKSASSSDLLALSGMTGLGVGDSFAAIIGTWSVINML